MSRRNRRKRRSMRRELPVEQMTAAPGERRNVAIPPEIRRVEPEQKEHDHDQADRS